MHIRKTLAEIQAEVASKTSQPLTPTPEKPYQQNDDCPNCGGSGWLREDVLPSHPKFGKPVRCENPMHYEDRLKRLNQITPPTESDLRKRLEHITESPKNQQMLVAARELVNDPQGWLFIWGGPGNAKTDCLQAIVNELNLKGEGPATYVTLGELLDYIRETQKPNPVEEYVDRYNRLKGIKVLAIDEMDKTRATEFADEFRFKFLNERYRSAEDGKTVTIFAGNTDPQEFEIAPLYDRFRDGRFKVVENTAPSARPEMRRG